MKELELAKRLAVKAGDMLLRNQGGRRDIRYKEGRGNLVTDMDHASEEMIVRAIRREFPDHAIVAEESGARGDSPFRWFIDPLDGTTNYAHGLPVYGVTIAYEAHGKIQAGAVYAPAIGDHWWARRGGGAFKNGRPIRVSTRRKLEDSVLCTGFSYNVKFREQNLRHFSNFLPRARALRRMGAASVDICWTASGAFDGFWEFCLGPWDMAAGLLIVEEAGGIVSGFDGGPVDLFRGELLAANRAIHPRMLEVLRRLRR